MKYVIKGKEPEPEEQVVAELEKGDDGETALWVGNWIVFELYPNGTGHLRPGMPKDNKEGIQVDTEGKIKLVEL